MKSLCIKTNNSKLLQYLLNELKHFELSSICFSLRKFKHYNNIIIHYNGVDNSIFLNKKYIPIPTNAIVIIAPNILFLFI